jgi:hypothetical protein
MKQADRGNNQRDNALRHLIVTGVIQVHHHYQHKASSCLLYHHDLLAEW